MKKTIFLLFFGINMFGQDVIVKDSIQKSNPIIFFETDFGLLGSNNGGLYTLGINLNYQFNQKDLLTTRLNFNYGLIHEYLLLSPFTPFPFLARSEVQTELAFLYGKRFVFDNYSLSLSSGISYINRDYYQQDAGYYENLNERYFGVPFEINIKWFKAEKRRFRAYYGLIPIGRKKVSFGRSVGFKLMGNIAKNDYVGLAFTYGFGWHKKY